MVIGRYYVANRKPQLWKHLFDAQLHFGEIIVKRLGQGLGLGQTPPTTHPPPNFLPNQHKMTRLTATITTWGSPT